MTHIKLTYKSIRHKSNTLAQIVSLQHIDKCTCRMNLWLNLICLWQRIPIWWRWYYWGCPVAWTLYGLVASQYGDVEDVLESGETVKDFVRSYFGYRHDFLGVVATVIVWIPLFFAFIFALSIKAFNFQTRWVFKYFMYII